MATYMGRYRQSVMQIPPLSPPWIALLIVVLFTSLFPQTSYAKGKTYSSHKDWNVIVARRPFQCWAVSVPKNRVLEPNTERVARRMNRGKTRLFVLLNQNSEEVPEVSFAAGYEIDKEATVQLQIGGQVYPFFAEGGSSWPDAEDADRQIIKAMMAGREAIVTVRGDATSVDTFSLLGLSAALESAKEACE